MTSDGDDAELHAFAKKIGVDKGRFVNGSAFDHYDLTPLKRAQAVKEGAIEVNYDTLREVMWVYKSGPGRLPT